MTILPDPAPGSYPYSPSDVPAEIDIVDPIDPADRDWWELRTDREPGEGWPVESPDYDELAEAFLAELRHEAGCLL